MLAGVLKDCQRVNSNAPKNKPPTAAGGVKMKPNMIKGFLDGSDIIGSLK